MPNHTGVLGCLFVAKCVADATERVNGSLWHESFVRAMHSQCCEYIEVKAEADTVDIVTMIVNSFFRTLNDEQIADWEWDPTIRFNPYVGEPSTVRLWSWAPHVRLLKEELSNHNITI